MKELFNIQMEVKATKSQRNTFGNYNYRSCEDILEKAKPILAKYHCCITLSDSIQAIGDRVYVIATATLHNQEGESYSVTAGAREEEVKKGMDAAQITGAASSYARKYALSGLLALDDNNDPDSYIPVPDEPKKAEVKKSEPERKYGAQQTKLIEMFTAKFQSDPLWPIIDKVLHVVSRDEFQTLYRTYSIQASGNENLFSTFKQVSQIYPKQN